MRKTILVGFVVVLLMPIIALADVDVLAGGWWDATVEELLAAREQLDAQIIALGGTVSDDTVNTAIALETDEYTAKYEEWAMYALEKIYDEPWKNPDSLKIHSMTIYVFPEGYERTYSYIRLGDKTETIITDEDVFFEIEYSAQNGFGGMNRGDYAVYLTPEEFATARQNYITDGSDSLGMIANRWGGDKEHWVYTLFGEVRKNYNDYQRYNLDVTYLLSKFSAFERLKR